MTVRIVHVSDIHFGCENRPALAALHERLRSTPFDVLAVTGDITQAGYRREFLAAHDWLKRLPGPQVCTPGNHDTPYFDLVARLFYPFARYHRFIGPEYEGLAIPGLQVVGINTARGAQPRMNWSKGQIRLSDARKACRLLSGAGAALRVVICHHPLMEVTGGPMTGIVWNGTRASRVLAEGGVDLILTGHVHMPFAHPLPFGDRRTYAVGASTLSLRERGTPAGYTEIEAEPDCIRVKAMAWTQGRYEPLRSWGFDRRRSGPAGGTEASGSAERAA